MEDQVIRQSEAVSFGASHVDNDELVASTLQHPLSSTFPKLLQGMRNARTWSKADLAKRAGFDPSTITRLEQGSRVPERETVLQLADAMALPVPDRDRMLAAAGYRSETWDDPDLIQIAAILADPALPATVHYEIRTILRMAISHGSLARAGMSRRPVDR